MRQGSKSATVLCARGITPTVTCSNDAYISVQGKYRDVTGMKYYLHTNQMHNSTKNFSVMVKNMKDHFLSGDINHTVYKAMYGHALNINTSV